MKRLEKVRRVVLTLAIGAALLWGLDAWSRVPPRLTLQQMKLCGAVSMREQAEWERYNVVDCGSHLFDHDGNLRPGGWERYNARYGYAKSGVWGAWAPSDHWSMGPGVT